MKRIVVLSLCILSLEGTFTLDKAQRYAVNMPEAPEVIGNILYPDYTEWYQQNSPSFFSRFLMMMGITETLWSVRDLTSLLHAVTTQREQAGNRMQDTYIGFNLVIKPPPGSTFILIGPLYGAYHSLVRIVTELHRQGVIDLSGKILKPHTYIVSLGNVVDSSPMNLETLTLMLMLMKANPEKCIYLAGEQETHDSWMGSGLKRELTQRIGTSALDASLARFFKTLPFALFLQNGQDVIKVSDNVYSQKRCSSQALVPGATLTCPQSDDTAPLPRVFIQGEHRLMSYQRHTGLVQVPAKEGVTTWALFNSPTFWHRTFFSFRYDAFAILSITQSFARSELSLYAQNADDRAGFRRRANYEVFTGKNLMTSSIALPPDENPFIPSRKMVDRLKACKHGEALASIEHKEPVYIGCTIDLSKGGSPIGKAVRDGIVLRLAAINAQGGFNGRPLQIVFMDDEYSPEKARHNVEEFIQKYQSNLFLCNLGSPTLETYIELVKQEKIFIFFPITGAPIFRKADIKGIIHWRASYETEARMLTQYMVDTLKVRNFAFLYQSDSYGLGALEGSNQVINKEGIKQALNVAYERNTTSFSPQIKQIKDASVTGLGFFSTSLAATEFIRQAGVEFFIGKKLFALSDLAAESFKKFVQQRGLDMIIAQFAPNPKTSELPLVQEFRRAHIEEGLPLVDVFTLEGYISTSLMHYILTKAGSDYSIQSLNKVIESLKDDVYKGLPLAFNASTRELVHELWLDTGAEKWIWLSSIDKGSS